MDFTPDLEHVFICPRSSSPPCHCPHAAIMLKPLPPALSWSLSTNHWTSQLHEAKTSSFWELSASQSPPGLKKKRCSQGSSLRHTPGALARDAGEITPKLEQVRYDLTKLAPTEHLPPSEHKQKQSPQSQNHPHGQKSPPNASETQASCAIM